MGAVYTTDLSFAVDGVEQAVSTPNVYGDYVVDVCRNSQTSMSDTQHQNTYSFTVQRGNEYGDQDLTAEDLAKTFTLSFTPVAGEVPLVAEGHVSIESFAISAALGNRITLTLKPIGYSDIWSCATGPIQCVVEHTQADNDKVAYIGGGVRYKDVHGWGAPGFGDLPGMTWSSAGFLFFLRASCPASVNHDDSFSGLNVDLGGPHLRADGELNIGSVVAFLPAAAVAGCFGGSPQAFVASAQVTRTENHRTQTATTGGTADPGLQYVLTATDAGVTLSIPNVTFSQPTYKMKTKHGSLARTTKTVSSLVKASKLVKPSHGSLRFVIASASKRICIATKVKVYGFKTGTCKYTVTSYNSKGKKVKSKASSFKVR